MKKTFLTLGACAVAGLALMGLRTANRLLHTHFDFDFPVERCSNGLFV